MPIKIAHIVNPVIVDNSSDLKLAQPVTFESLRVAQQFAQNSVDVNLYSAQFPEDIEIVPEWLTKTRNLDRSVLDVGHFEVSRKLPLIKDILDRLYESSSADYYIYTNVDIALMPHFYLAIVQLIEAGNNAIVVNRRTIANEPSNPEHLPLMWSQIGEKHPGYDCFIFRRDVYKLFQLGTICIGANWIGRALLTNLLATENSSKVLEKEHLTFHLGDDQGWKSSLLSEFDTHNEKEFLRLFHTIQSINYIESHPLVEKIGEDLFQKKSEKRSVNNSSLLRRWLNTLKR